MVVNDRDVMFNPSTLSESSMLTCKYKSHQHKSDILKLQVWRRFCTAMATSRHKGTYTNFVTRVVSEGGSSNRGNILKQHLTYQFLYTQGISTHRRIQQLTTLLGIHYSQLETDRLLYSCMECREDASLNTCL